MAKRERGAGEQIHKALTHPMRADILLRMQEEGQLSPVTYSKANGQSLNLSAYHFNTLAQHGAIELVDTKARRGATEHIYAINRESPVVRFLFASKMTETPSQDASEEFLRRLVSKESDSGGAVTITPVVVDKEGRREVKEILEEAGQRLRDAQAASRSRLERSNEKPTSLHVALAALRWNPTEDSLSTRRKDS